MKYLGLVLVMLLVLGFCGVAQARNLNDVSRTVIDTLTGDNDSCPMTTSLYVAKTFKDMVNLPIVGKADWRTELSYTSSIKQINTDNYVNLKTGLEF